MSIYLNCSPCEYLFNSYLAFFSAVKKPVVQPIWIVIVMTAIVMRRSSITQKSRMMTMTAKLLVQHHHPHLATVTWLVRHTKIPNTKDN